MSVPQPSSAKYAYSIATAQQCEVRLCQCHSKAVWTTLMSVPVLNSAGVLHGHQSRTSWRQKGATLEKIKSEKNFEEVRNKNIVAMICGQATERKCNRY